MAGKRKLDGNSHTKSQRDYAHQYNPNSDAYDARVTNEEKMRAEQERRYILSLFVSDPAKSIPCEGWNRKVVFEPESNLQNMKKYRKPYETSWPDPVPANGWHCGGIKK